MGLWISGCSNEWFYKWDYDNVEYAYGLASQFNVTQITGQQGFGCSPYPGLEFMSSSHHQIIIYINW